MYVKMNINDVRKQFFDKFCYIIKYCLEFHVQSEIYFSFFFFSIFYYDIFNNK